MKTEATQVKGCKKCDEKVGSTQNFVFIAGGIMLFLSIYGLVSVIKDIMSFF
jgi:hypothetical protein